MIENSTFTVTAHSGSCASSISVTATDCAVSLFVMSRALNMLFLSGAVVRIDVRLTMITQSWCPDNQQRCCVIAGRSEEHTSELQSLMRISYAVFCLKKKNKRRLM